MYRIIVVPQGSTANVVLFFKSREAAEIQQKNIHEMQKDIMDPKVLVAKDDFGHVLTMNVRTLAYSLFIDPDKAAELGMGQERSPMVSRPAKPNGDARPEIIVP